MNFNRLNDAEAERLAILAEECGEVLQTIGKILRHGYESKNPLVMNSKTNRQALELELGDLMFAITFMCRSGDIVDSHVSDHADSKTERIKPYLHHQDADL
jgi:NTP pyrophosphatase (non-canonical NTP hydrolase)